MLCLLIFAVVVLAVAVVVAVGGVVGGGGTVPNVCYWCFCCWCCLLGLATAPNETMQILTTKISIIVAIVVVASTEVLTMS